MMSMLSSRLVALAGLGPSLATCGRTCRRTTTTRSSTTPLWSSPWQCPLCSTSTRTQALLSQHLSRRHARWVSVVLASAPLDAYLNIFGEEYKSVNEKELRYKDGLIVTLKGDHMGQWYSFTQNKGGGPIRAIQMAREVGFFEAMMEAVTLVRSLGRLHLLREFEQQEQLAASGTAANGRAIGDREASDHAKMSRLFNDSNLLEDTTLSRIRSAQNIWRVCQPLYRSSAELYLTQHRGIRVETLHRLAFRFLRVGVSFLDESMNTSDKESGTRVINKSPALVVRVENSDGDLTAVQRIFLDPLTCGKPTWHEIDADCTQKVRHKFTKGVLSGSLGVVQKGSFGDVLFITEGPETGATIVDVLPQDNECTVMAALSLANVLNGVDVMSAQYPRLVVFAADNDGQSSNKRTLDVYQNLKDVLNRRGIEVKLALPHLELAEKADWNDVLLKCGATEVRRQLLYQNDINL